MLPPSCLDCRAAASLVGKGRARASEMSASGEQAWQGQIGQHSRGSPALERIEQEHKQCNKLRDASVGPRRAKYVLSIDEPNLRFSSVSSLEPCLHCLPIPEGPVSDGVVPVLNRLLDTWHGVSGEGVQRSV